MNDLVVCNYAYTYNGLPSLWSEVKPNTKVCVPSEITGIKLKIFYRFIYCICMCNRKVIKSRYINVVILGQCSWLHF